MEPRPTPSTVAFHGQAGVRTGDPSEPSCWVDKKRRNREPAGAEPDEDLVVIGDASGCSSWIGQALEQSQFLAVVRTPAAPSVAVIVQASLAEKHGVPLAVRRRPWVAFRVRRRAGDPRLPLGVLSVLCEQLVQAGVEPRALVPVDSRSYLLVVREQVQVALAAAVRPRGDAGRPCLAARALSAQYFRVAKTCLFCRRWCGSELLSCTDVRSC
ncbi:unnamed protein product [Prorocentrum cordatum]|uniref:Uncharacterized protein n=1 Tax=Prorocentrum cordatum TaxID=2364126 RepID=A0ABN9T0P4_9DINO|nr:unnamed protein product [Polarella glacialis]